MFVMDQLNLLAHKPTILALFACLIVLVVFWNRVLTNRRFRPPGPRGLPFIGNTFQLSGRTWLLFDKWKQEYGRPFDASSKLSDI